MNHLTAKRPPWANSPISLPLAIAAIFLALRSPSAFANPEPETPESAMHAGLTQLAEGKPDEAIKSFALAESLDTASDNQMLRERARFNTALAHFTAGRPDDAAKLFRDLAGSTRDSALAASAQYQLGLIEHGRAVKSLESASRDTAADQADETLEFLRRAERHFRNAQGDATTANDARRNIDLTQRLIAAVQRQREQQQKQQQQDNKQDQQKNDQDQNKEQKGDQNKQDQSKEEQSKQGQSNKDQQQKDPSDENPQQSPGDQRKQPQQKKNKDSQKKDASEPTPGEKSEEEKAKQAKADKAKAEQQQAEKERQEQQQGKEGEAKDPAQPFDLTAAQILDKERRERAALERILRQLSGRPARVEKDW